MTLRLKSRPQNLQGNRLSFSPLGPSTIGGVGGDGIRGGDGEGGLFSMGWGSGIKGFGAIRTNFEAV